MTIDRETYTEKLRLADEAMKRTDGHTFLTILKTRCIYCGRSPRARGICRGWMQSFVEHLYDELNRDGAA